MYDLDGLYAAIDDDDALADLSAAIARACGTRSAMIRYDQANSGMAYSGMSYWPPAPTADYFMQFADSDPWMSLVRIHARERRAICYDAILPPQQFQHSAMFNELLRPLGDDTGRCLGFTAAAGGARMIVGVHRAADDLPCGECDAARLEAVCGHVERVFRVRAVHDAERLTTTAMLDAGGRAMLVVDRTLRILRATRAAERMLDRRDGLRLAGGRLAVTDVAIGGALRAAVQATIDRTTPARSAFLCPRKADAPPYRILVAPGGRRPGMGALLIVDDGRIIDDTGRRRRWLRDCYGLTTAELALAEGLATGDSLDRIAEQRGVTRETVRSQLKSLFHKTSTQRQADLARLLAGVPDAIEPTGGG